MRTKACLSIDARLNTARHRIRTRCGGWAPELTALITDSDVAPFLRPLYALPTPQDETGRESLRPSRPVPARPARRRSDF
ncbi:hypothetical protein C1N81_43140 [Streptomyces sp. SGAir0957]